MNNEAKLNLLTFLQREAVMARAKELLAAVPYTPLMSTEVEELSPQACVPSEGRVAWLSAHGVPPTGKVKVSFSAPLVLWEAAGAEIGQDGSVSTKGYAYYGPRLSEALEQAVYTLWRAEAPEYRSPTVEELSTFLAHFVALREESKATKAAEDAKKEAEEAAYRKVRDEREKARQEATTREQARQEAEDAAKVVADATWVRAYGSERLKLALSQGLLATCEKSLREEQLAHAFPAGWDFLAEKDREGAVVEPTEEQLKALTAARELLPASNVGLAFVRRGHLNGCITAAYEDRACDCGGKHKGRALVADFMDCRVFCFVP